MIFFRFPFSETIYTAEENSAAAAVTFLSFDQSEKLDFKGNLKAISLTEFLKHEIFNEDLITELHHFNEENEIDYQHKLSNVIDFIKENQLSKLVISRRKLVEFSNSKISLSQTFLILCEFHINLYDTKQEEEVKTLKPGEEEIVEELIEEGIKEESDNREEVAKE